jgi:HPt (histidine-containing phosphotransfer) domain-containing protein
MLQTEGADHAHAANAGVFDATVEGPLDDEVLDAMASIARDGAPRLLERIAVAFAEDAPRQVRRMRRAIAEETLEELRRGAHALKSSAASIGAARLARLCATVEDDAKSGRAGHAAATLQVVEDQVAQVEAALRARVAAGGVHVFR